MSTATETITVTLVQSVGGLMAEIGPMPVFAGPEWEARARKYEMARAALQAEYPHLIVRASSVEDDTVLFFVERI